MWHIHDIVRNLNPVFLCSDLFKKYVIEKKKTAKRVNARLRTQTTFTQTLTGYKGFRNYQRDQSNAQRGMWEIQLTALNFAAA